MNHNRKPLTNAARKKSSKEIKKAQKDLVIEEPSPTTKELSVKSVLKKYPKKTVKGDETTVKSLVKKMEITKKKKITKHSKRTTPGIEFDENTSTPAHVKPEGVRWLKTVVVQSKSRGKTLTAKLRKKK